MRKFIQIGMLAATLLASSFHFARADDSVYQAFGGTPGLTKIVDDFVNTVLADPRIKGFFTQADIPNLKMRLVEQFCQLTGGPCTYGGLDMTTAHKGMGVKDANFNALAEDLQFAMDRAGIPFRTQNYLVSQLASMEKLITYK